MITEQNKTDLKNMSKQQLVRYVERLEQPSFRGEQLLAWIYRPGIIDFSQMTDLAKEFRALLSQRARISRFENPLVEVSKDGSVKFGFTLEDARIIESVLIPEEDRNTLCVSTQVGCAIGCTFCQTGKMGFIRNLKTSEIINQICGARDWMLQHEKGELTNLVFMGMGEPLANLDNLLAALSILTEQRGLDFSSRRITVSTSGLIPQMLEFGKRTEVNLAVSLHAVDNATRNKLMPINKKYPLEELLAACKQYQMKKRQRIMFEYVLLEGVNDSDATADKLADLLRGIPCKINLLQVNEIAGTPYHSPGREQILKFQERLRRRGYTVFIRHSRGEDISAACGQLAAKEEAGKKT